MPFPPVTVYLVVITPEQPLFCDPAWLAALKATLPPEALLVPEPILAPWAVLATLTTDTVFIPLNQPIPFQGIWRLQEAAYQLEQQAVVIPLTPDLLDNPPADPALIDAWLYCLAQPQLIPLSVVEPQLLTVFFVRYTAWMTVQKTQPHLPATAQDWIEAWQDQGWAISLCDALYWPDWPVERLPRSVYSAPVPLARLKPALTAILSTASPHPGWPGLDTQPVQLHISHDWGGGIERWLQDFTTTETACIHLVLKSKSTIPGEPYGQALALYRYPQTAVPLRQWVLYTNPIMTTAITHPTYQMILRWILSRYAVNAVLISSVIGHSLDCLTTGLPTQWLFHDYYPYCPVLNIYFNQLCTTCTAEHLSTCLADNPLAQLFHDQHNTQHWQHLRQQWLNRLQTYPVQLLAPSQTVQRNITTLIPALNTLPWAIIPHGMRALPPLPVEAAIDITKLRILVLGRLTPAKGLFLLEEILPTLSTFADVYLLGCDLEPARFQANPAIHCTPHYQPVELATLIAQFQPDCGLLLSIVPETYSYTLSELLTLGIPPVVTATGSFQERIIDTQNGFIIPEPTAAQVLAKLTLLHQDRTALQTVRNHLKNTRQTTDLTTMVAAYRTHLPLPAQPAQSIWRTTPPHATIILHTHPIWQEAITTQQQLAQQAQQLQQQTQEQQERLNWIQQLQSHIEELAVHIRHYQQTQLTQKQHFETQQQELLQIIQSQAEQLAEQQTHSQHQAEQILEQLQHIQHWQQRYQTQREEFLTSTSWKITAPLRATRHAWRALKHQSAHHRERIIHAHHRIRHSLRIRGGLATVQRLYQLWQQQRSTASSTQSLIPVNEQPQQPLQFTQAATPLVSIIIPVYNHYAHTHACLKALQQHATADIPTEIIVIDDASTDQTASALSKISGIVLHTQAHNQGFIAACNAGAALARGEYLLFLNNDTVVSAGWLTALLATFTQYPQAGLVGAQLIYPDGHLQEAGGLVFSDGSGWNYGRFQDPLEPRFNYVREVDYCSGACIMLPKALFDAVGGLDTRYQPAYYEDTDLAFKIRATGKVVLYQPQARIIHYEGISAGTDIHSGTKRYQAINQYQFQQRWAIELQQQASPIHADIERLKDRNTLGAILVIDACMPTPDQDSGSVRMKNLLIVLRKLRYKVTFFADNRLQPEPYTSQLQALGIEVLYQPYLPSPQAYLAQEGHRFQAIIISRYYIAQTYINWVRQYCPQARLIFDTVDLHYLREQRQAELTPLPALQRQAARTRQQEQAVIAASDITLVVSPYEQQVLAKEMPNRRVEILSNIHAWQGTTTPFAARQDIIFIGGFEHPPNVDAMHWFTEAVLPLIWQALPQLQLYIIGSKPPKSILDLAQARIIVTGYVPDLTPYLHQCRLSVAPLRYGAGVKGKINTSMSVGLPVVATPLAIEGMFLTPDYDVLVANTAADFAQQVIRLYQDPVLWQALSERGGENLRQHFSFAAAEQVLTRLLSTT